MEGIYFKIHQDNTPLSGVYSGPSTGLHTAISDYNKKLHHLKSGTLKLVAYENNNKITILSTTK